MPAQRRFAASYSTTEINKSGAEVFDEAWARGGVEIRRRQQRFALVRQDVLERMIAEAGDHRPRSLDDLLRDYDACKVKDLTDAFLNAPAKGRERI